MLDQLLNNPDIRKYLTSFMAGQTLFVEHDASQDLYILVSGEVDVLKGTRKISEIKERGAMFGEMSLFLESRRTATVKAKTDVEAIVIPPDRVDAFMKDCPDAVWEITRYLARRLDKTSQILFGLNEFYDQLPDAVILTDREGNVLSWNSAATRLYGMNWDEMSHRSAEGLYEEPERYREYLAEVQEKFAVRERILKVRHPKTGVRYISTSMNVLYDGHHNFQGGPLHRTGCDRCAEGGATLPQDSEPGVPLDPRYRPGYRYRLLRVPLFHQGVSSGGHPETGAQERVGQGLPAPSVCPCRAFRVR